MHRFSGPLGVGVFGDNIGRGGAMLTPNELVFTALHVMQTRSSDQKYVRLSAHLSVRPSVTRVYCDKTVERSVQIYIPYERTFILDF